MITRYESPLSGGGSAYDAMLDAIKSGQILPGDRLREEEIAKDLNLSRTPVREALRRLEADGIVEHRPRVGSVIRSLGHTEIVELYEMRIVLERTAAQLAAKHGTPAEFDALESLNSDIVRERRNSAKAAAINQTFHQGLYFASRNRFLVETTRALNNALLLLGPTTYTDETRIDVVVQQHHRIIAALREGDEAAAGAAAQDHLQTSLRHRLRTMAP